MILQKDVIDGTKARRFSILKIFVSSTRPRKFLVTFTSEREGTVSVTVCFSEISPGVHFPSIKVRPTSPYKEILDGAKLVFERRCLDFIRQSKVMEGD